MTTKFLNALNGKENVNPPVWVMRQAGRYLPEYQKVRKSCDGFFDLCFTPQKAKEVTLQPIDRFGFDAAILFSDILVIPRALGVKIDFVEGRGPVVETLQSVDDLKNLDSSLENIEKTTKPVYETVKLVREELAEDKSLIGFCGAPWTLALYMLDSHPSKDSLNSRTWAYAHPEAFDSILQMLVDTSVEYLDKQIQNGADAVQVFDSWAGSVPYDLFERCIAEPLLQICERLKAIHPNTPITLFPKGIHKDQLLSLAQRADGRFDCLGIDFGLDINWAVENLQDKVCIQGNLDPGVLLTSPEIVKVKAEQILKIAATKKTNFIFNLGHGITPKTPIENVEALVKTVQNWQGYSN